MNYPPRAPIAALRIIIICILPIAAGCIDQQEEVAAYRKVLDGPQVLTVSRDYSHGKALSLEAALLLANQYQEQLAIQGEDYLQALIAKDRAYSTFLPTVSLAPTLSWQNRPLNTGGTTFAPGAGTTGLGGTNNGSGTGSVVGEKSNKYTAFDLPISAKANLFNGFRDVSAIRAAWADVSRRKFLLLDLQETVLLETAQTYYQVMRAERSVEVLHNSVDFQEARVRDMLSRMRAGVAQPLDVAQSQAQAAATRSQLVAAENDVRNGRVTLAYLTDAKVRNATLVDRLRIPETLPPAMQAVEIGQRTRPDIAAAAAAVQIARQNVQIAIGEYYPSLSLDLNYYLHRETFPTNAEWAGLLFANLPIFSAGTIHADVRAAWSQLRQAMLQEWQLVRQVGQDVQVDWQNLDASMAQIRELETEVAAAQEALRQATRRYQTGLAINLDVLNAEDQLLSAQLDLATAQFNYKIFYLDLVRAMGQLTRPSSLSSMSYGPASRPTTEQTRPVLPGYDIPPMRVPGTGP